MEAAVEIDNASIVMRTARVLLRKLDTRDADFMLELLNDAAFLEHIGDRGVRTLEDAARYIENGAMASYARSGFGFYCVVHGKSGARIGICGLARREALEDVDIGFAYLPAYRGAGYGFEAAEAVMRHARDVLGLQRIVAITAVANRASANLLEKLGLRFERMLRVADDEPEIRLFAWSAESATHV